MMTYQGYASWETWAVSLWFDNTYSVYRLFMDEVEVLRDQGKGDRTIVIILARQAREYVEDHELLGEIFGPGEKGDLDVVDWEEVASSFVME